MKYSTVGERIKNVKANLSLVELSILRFGSSIKSKAIVRLRNRWKSQ